MKQAVISIGGKQYLVNEGMILDVELQKSDKGPQLQPLLVFDEKEFAAGQPLLEKPLVTTEILDTVRGDKVIAIRYKAKKRVDTRRGHRQTLTRLKITKIG